MRFIRKHINEGMFKNPEQAKAALAKKSEKSHAEIVAAESNNIICSKLKEICDSAIIKVTEDRVRNVHIDDNSDIILDVDYVQANRSGYDGAETTFLGRSFSFTNAGKDSDGRRNAKIDLDYDKLANTNFIKDVCYMAAKKDVDAVKTEAIKKINTLTEADPDYGYYDTLKERNIVIEKFNTFSRYHNVNITALTYKTEYDNQNFVQSDMPFMETSRYSDESIEKIGKELVKYFIFENSGDIRFFSHNKIHADFSKNGKESYFKILVREALEFSYRQFYKSIIETLQEKGDQLRDWRPVSNRRWDDDLSSGYGSRTSRDMEEYDQLLELEEKYLKYMLKQKDAMYSSKFKIVKIGICYETKCTHIMDKETGEMTKVDEMLKEYGKSYLKYPKSLLYIKYTLDGTYYEYVCFTAEYGQLHTYFIGSIEKAISNLRVWDKNNHGPIGLVKYIIEQEANGRLLNLTYYNEAFKRFQQSIEYKTIVDIIRHKLYLF